ncbi:MAG: thiamine phosphate synthase [Thermogemmatispora sp.]|uniref:thiamine phosphate synthase n=1 Tax=Thermogemmatispora sp. TaxID=1968838 RepID=UPI002605A52B|nr:thiamine phosphate synthase [Thermogemmatispora sp.]MBX5458835.1 thiamine phosphate synthase [Thermogemmatispora sp.]
MTEERAPATSNWPALVAARGPLLCLVTDEQHPALVEIARQALEAGIDLLQLRGPSLSAARLYELAVILGPLARQHGARLIINDRLDVALAVGADGVQLGRRSLPLAAARTLLQRCGQSLLLGASVHSLAEAEEAVAAGADYLLAGTIFPSPSHPGQAGAGVELLERLRARWPRLPLLAIGGLSATNAARVIEAGADGIAVISAIYGAASVAQAVDALRQALAAGSQARRQPPHDGQSA